VSASPSLPDSPDPEPWFARELRTHEGELRGYLSRQFPGVDADDVLQESYLKLRRAEPPGRIESAKAYLFSVARNTASRLFQRRRKLYSDQPVNELPDWRLLEGGPDAAESANARQRLELAAAAIDRLPPRCREIVRLAVVDGLASPAIARRLGLAEPTVRVQLARGIAKCSDYLRSLGEIP